MKIMNKKMTIIITFIALFLTFTSFSLNGPNFTAVKAAQVASHDLWVSKNPMEQARAGAGVAVVNSKVYVIGGDNGNVVASNEEYNPATNNWALKTPMPNTRFYFGAAVYKDKIYCIGGENSAFSDSDLNEVYNPANDSWETKAPIPTPTRNIQANVVDGKIYVIGGDTNPTLNQVYDPANNSWTIQASIPTGVYGYASPVIGSKIYVFNYGLTQIYDAQTDSWSRGAPAPLVAISVTAGATTGVFAPERIYFFGVDSSNAFLAITDQSVCNPKL
jgi:N-acetylneuraminic acid mutarotase